MASQPLPGILYCDELHGRSPGIGMASLRCPAVGCLHFIGVPSLARVKSQCSQMLGAEIIGRWCRPASARCSFVPLLPVALTGFFLCFVSGTGFLLLLP